MRANQAAAKGGRRQKKLQKRIFCSGVGRFERKNFLLDWEKRGKKSHNRKITAGKKKKEKS